MKTIYFLALALSLSMSVSAQKQTMHLTLNDGTTQTFNVADIKEMTFSEDDQPLAEVIAGEYSGSVTLAVGSIANYTVDIKPVISANEDGTVNFTYPEYVIPNTIMGNLTLGTLTIDNIPYVEEEGAFVLDYSNAGLKQHFTCVNAQGATTMDSDYTLGQSSVIRIEVAADGIKVTNPFKLGAMPFPLTATFEGNKGVQE